MEVTSTAWAVTIGLIVLLLGLDLAVGALRPHAVGFAEATAWSVFYVGVAVAFGLVLGAVAGWDFGTQYFAGYLVEKSLSVDNLFVFVVIMTTFAVPREHQQKALTFGIVMALVMRAIFIAVGAALLQLFSFMFLVFGLLLIWTAVQLYRHRDEDPEVEDNVLVQGLLDRLVYLSTGLAVVLAFIGVKLILHWGHTLSDAVPEIPTLLSLGVIVVILAITIVASLAKVRRDPVARAHAGSLRAHPRDPKPEPPGGPS